VRRWTFILLAVVVTMAAAIPASAFDGKRKGFLLGGGLGLGSYSYTLSIDDLEGPDESTGSLVTNFKIGGGFSEQFLLYYNAHINWFSQSILDTDLTVASGISGLGFTWFTNPDPKGLFLTGTLGFASWDYPFEDDSDMLTGFGVALGLGYEFAPHWAVDLNLMFGSPERSVLDATLKSEFVGLAVTVTGLAY